MAVGAFPLFKLGFLVIKQISKPIANGIARRAKASPIFKDYICIPTAQLFHWYDVRVRMRMLNLGKATAVPKLNEAKAIETGAQLLSEVIILGVGTAILFLEYRRQSEKDSAKAEAADRERAYLNDKIEDLEFRLERQTVDLKNLTRTMHALQDQVEGAGIKGWFNKKSRAEAADKTEGEGEGDEVPVPTKLVPSEPAAFTDPAAGYSEGLVLGAVADLVGPLPEEARTGTEALATPFAPHGDLAPARSTDYVPGAITEAAEYFLHGCRDD